MSDKVAHIFQFNCWLVVLFYGISTLFGSFNGKLSHFDKSPNKSVSYKYRFCMYTDVKTVRFQAIQFSISTQFSFISPIGATIPGHSVPGSGSNEGVLRITQSPSITGTSSSDFLVSYQDTHWESLTHLQRSC